MQNHTIKMHAFRSCKQSNNSVDFGYAITINKLVHKIESAVQLLNAHFILAFSQLK